MANNPFELNFGSNVNAPLTSSMNSISGYSPSNLNLPGADTANGLALGDNGGGWMDSITSAFGSDGLFNSDTLKGFGSIAGGIGGIMGAMNAKDQLNLMEDQFGFQKDFANRNIANQAQIINNKIVGDEQRYLQDLRGNDDNQAGYDRNQAKGAQLAQKKTVDGSAVG